MTAKLVKARPKALKDLPAWAKCCKGMIAEIGRCGEITIDIAALTPAKEGTCRHCFKSHKLKRPFAKIVEGAAGAMAPLEILVLKLSNENLDEGPTA